MKIILYLLLALGLNACTLMHGMGATATTNFATKCIAFNCTVNDLPPEAIYMPGYADLTLDVQYNNQNWVCSYNPMDQTLTKCKEIK